MSEMMTSAARLEPIHAAHLRSLLSCDHKFSALPDIDQRNRELNACSLPSSASKSEDLLGSASSAIPSSPSSSDNSKQPGSSLSQSTRWKCIHEHFHAEQADPTTRSDTPCWCSICKICTSYSKDERITREQHENRFDTALSTTQWLITEHRAFLLSMEDLKEQEAIVPIDKFYRARIEQAEAKERLARLVEASGADSANRQPWFGAIGEERSSSPASSADTVRYIGGGAPPDGRK